jgi:pyrrolidone-carboxylate peptidase
VLLLGFEPFGGDTVNPSQQVLNAFVGRKIAGHRIETALLPVAFAPALTELSRRVEATSPALALALGLAATRNRLSLERVAISQATLAEMIGTTRSRVNFFMNKFRKLGLIEYNGNLKVNSSLLSVVLHD